MTMRSCEVCNRIRPAEEVRLMDAPGVGTTWACLGCRGAPEEESPQDAADAAAERRRESADDVTSFEWSVASW